MKDSIRRKLEKLDERFEEISRLLSDPGVIARQNQFRELSMEYARAGAAGRAAIAASSRSKGDAATARELATWRRSCAGTWRRGSPPRRLELQRLLVPKDPHDDSNIFLEVRAGTGGDEAAIFAGDLFRMYARYAESKRWEVEILSESPGEHGGYKEIISRIIGRGAFSLLKFESGTHRVQRVPATEAQGRIHTSACTVAILPELEEVEAVELNPADLRIDTYRSSGAGGQHVNKTDSAIRITHLPHRHRGRMPGRALAAQEPLARHVAAEGPAARRANAKSSRAQQAQSRKLQVGSGDRSERIRTYNFPQGRVTDHRINLTLYKLDDVMNGNLDELIGALNQEHQAEELAQQVE